MKPAGYHVPDRHIQIVGPDAFVSSGTEIFTVQAGAAIADRQRALYRRLPAPARRQLEDRARACVDAADAGRDSRKAAAQGMSPQ